MKKVVVDCSVAVKWFFTKNELFVSQADQLIKKHLNKKLKILAPELILIELLNVVLVAKKIDLEKAKKIVKTFYKSNLEIKNVDRKQLEQAAFYTNKYEISFYDASYVALAKINNCQLVTDDVKLKNKTKLKFVKLLKDF